MRKILVSITPEIDERIVETAKSYGMSKSGFVRFCIVKQFEQKEAAKQ